MPGYMEYMQKEEIPYAVVGKEGLKDNTLVHKITGKLDYADDRLPGRKLVARALLAPYAKADINSIDTSAAEALDGVYAVTTYEDTPAFSDKVRHWGQDIAAVAAVDSETAARAVELIEVDYDVGEHVIDPEEAMEPGAPLTGIWEDTNVREAEITRGDIETGLAEADQEIEVEAGWTNMFQHKEMEPRSATCYWVGDQLYVWTTSQNPFGQRAGLGGRLVDRKPGYEPPADEPEVGPLPLHKIHLVSHGSGSGHGNKHFNEWITIAARLAEKAGMPVSYHLNRPEHICGESTHQFKGKLEARFGVTDDGTLTAMDTTWLCDATSAGATRAGGLHFGLRYTFKCDHGRFHVKDIACNTPKSGPWRCVGDPPGDALYNLALEKVAAQLEMDPLEFRLKNLIPDDMVQYESGLPFSSVGIRECFEKAAEALDWDQNWHQPGERTLDDGRMHGIGISGHVDSHGQMSAPCGAILNLTKDGNCLISPGQSHCANSITSFVHMVAEVLGMKYEDVMVGEWGNTDSTSEGGSEGGSTQTITLGSAYVEAALDARKEAFEIAAEWMDVDPDDLTAEEGVIYEIGNPDNSRTWPEVAGRFSWPIIGKGYSWEKRFTRPRLDWDVGEECEVRGQLAAAVEIAVDTETGHIEVLNFANAIDGGKVISHSNYHKASYGGCEIIMGEALHYEQTLDWDNGATLNANMWQNTFPTSMDINPEGFTSIAVESDDHCGPFGCKGIGEPQVSSLACIPNAFYNATGVWIDELPITPDKVLKALGKA